MEIIKAINTGNAGLALAMLFAAVFFWMILKVIAMDKDNGVIKAKLESLDSWMEKFDKKVDRAIERREHPR